MSQSGKMPNTKLTPVVLYDDLIGKFPESYDFPVDRDENDPALICYTSATTGDPKGVVYSHRGMVLHAYAVATALGALSGVGGYAVSFRAELPVGATQTATAVVLMLAALSWRSIAAWRFRNRA